MKTSFNSGLIAILFIGLFLLSACPNIQDGASYPVLYIGNGNSAGSAPLDAQRYAVGENVTALEIGNLAKLGYSFSAWNSAADGSGTAVSPGQSIAMGAQELKLYAQWSANSYELSFNPNLGSGSMASMSLKTDQVISLPLPNFTRAGYAIIGWGNSASSGALYSNQGQLKMPASSMVLYAQWSANPHTITFYPNGAAGSPVTQSLVTNQIAALSPNTFNFTGYSFQGWALSAEGAVEYANEAEITMGLVDIDLYAVWLVNAYRLSFSSGSSYTSGYLEEISLNYGSQINLPAQPYTYTGSTFAGWALELNGTVEYGNQAQFTMGAQDTILYGVWTPNYLIGGIGPAGGYVFYDKGYYSNGWRFMEAAANNQGGLDAWSPSATLVSGTISSLGSGTANTALIVTAFGTGTVYAARTCNDLVLGGQSNWFLPSRDEALAMATNLRAAGVGNIPSMYSFWTSTDSDASNAYVINLSNNPPTSNSLFLKTLSGAINTPKTRAVRRF